METSKNTGNGLDIGGIFTLECYDSKGNLKWSDSFKNGVTNLGLNDLLDVYFRQGTPLAGFAIGLIAGPANLSAGDTHASHGGWSEFTNYRVGNNALIRPTWVAGPPSAQLVVNPTLLDYTVTNAGAVAGAFIVGGSVGSTSPAAGDADRKGSLNVAPLLWATAQLSGGSQNVVGNDVLRLTYRVRAASA